MISETIEFVLWYEKDIYIALEDRRAGNQRGGTTGGNGSGHMKVSDPTVIQAIRNVAPINVLDVPYGRLYGKEPVYNKKPACMDVIHDGRIHSGYETRRNGCKCARH